MAKRIKDMRPIITTPTEAEAVLRTIAIATINTKRTKAMAEKRIATIKEKTEEAIAEDEKTIDELSAVLAAYIANNRDLFKKPKKISTIWGNFGLQKANALVITNKTKLIEHILEQGYDDCLKVKRTPIKPIIKARVAAGEKMPGCTIHKGDTAVYSVVKALPTEAKEENQ